MDVNNKVIALLTGPLKELGYDLAEVRTANEKDGLTLHIVVDRVDPISLDDIVKVSDLINPLLDKESPLDGPYTLDVSSLGAEKPLHLDKLSEYKDHYVNLHLSNPYKGANTMEGTIIQVDSTSLTLLYYLKSRPVRANIPLKDIDKARLAIKF
jgi:ribosome maturation factor RimP